MPILTSAILMLAASGSPAVAAPVRRPLKMVQPAGRQTPEAASGSGSGGKAYGPMILTTPIPKKQGMPNIKVAPARINPQATAAALEQQEKARKLAACNADRGQWWGTVQAKSLWATGSDVDEIYGSIMVGDISGATFSNSYMNTGQGWGRRQLWASKDNVNLGKTRQTHLSTITIRSPNPVSALSIAFNLRDEDDGRGGSNDEFFYIGDARSIYDNFRRYEFYVPPCAQNAEFQQEWREIIATHAYGSSASNKVFLEVRVRVWRLYR